MSGEAELRRRAVAALGHRVRTPMSLLLAVLDEAEEAPPAFDVSVARASAQSVHTDVESLIELASWPETFAHQAIELGVEVDAAVGACTGEHGPLDVAIVADVGEATTIQGDRRRLAWVLRQVVADVCQHTEPDQKVRIVAVADDRTVRIHVGQDGDPPADLTAHSDNWSDGTSGPMVEPTWQLAREIVRLHRGELRARNDSWEAVVELPLEQGEAPAAPATGVASDGTAGAVACRKAGSGTASRTVDLQPVGPPGAPLLLVVEDHDGMRAYLTSVLSNEQRVVAVESAEAAVAALRELQPDAIICDLILPGEDGESLVQALSADERLYSIPVIVVSGRSDLDVRARLLSAGADDFVAKPFAVAELRARVANLISLQRGNESLRRRAVDAEQLAQQLRHALGSRVLIEQAKAFVAADRGISVTDAFEVLRSHSRSNHVKLRALAEQVVLHGFRP